MRHQLAPRDAITMCSPWIRDHYTRAFACAIRQGNAGLLHELPHELPHEPLVFGGLKSAACSFHGVLRSDEKP